MKRDPIGDLEAQHAEVLNKMRTLSLRLNFCARASILTARAIADLHAKASRDLLNKLLKAEHLAPKRKATAKGRHGRPS